MNLPALEVPQFIILASIVYQHDASIIFRTSQLSNSAISPEFDPDDAVVMKINDEDCSDELVAVPALMDNVPSGKLARKNNDIFAVCSQKLSGPDVNDDETVLLTVSEDPLHNDRLVKQSRIAVNDRGVRAAL